MRHFIVIILLLTAAFSVSASEGDSFAMRYFNAWVATQQPNATEANLDSYLALLTQDVGHQHLPYDPEGSREPDNKEKMREGMNFYLGSHTSYSADLIDVVTGYNVIVIQYYTKSEGVHPETGETIKQEYDTIEVLEIEDGKVSVIRKYSE